MAGGIATAGCVWVADVWAKPVGVGCGWAVVCGVGEATAGGLLGVASGPLGLVAPYPCHCQAGAAPADVAVGVGRRGAGFLNRPVIESAKRSSMPFGCAGGRDFGL